MKRSIALAVVLVTVFSLFALGGCGERAKTEPPAETGDGGPEWPSQSEVIAAIDAVIADFDAKKYDLDQAIAELQKVIPKPEGYPARSIEYVIPWGEGGGSDSYARHIGQDAAKIMGVSIVYNNMPGGGGEIGLAYLLTQPADGYTIYGAIANQTINDALGTQPHSFTNDTDFIIRNQGATEIYWVRADSPFKTIQDAFEHAKANPGQLTICGAGAGGDDEFRIASLSKELGTDIIYVPYDKVGERTTSLLGGHVDIMHETAGTVIDLYKNGDIRPLAYGGSIVFNEIDPSIPCIADLGFSVPVGRWRGMVTVKGTDPKIIDYLHNSFYAASKLPYYAEYEVEFFQHLPKAYLNSEEFEEYAKHEVEGLRELAKELGYISD
jgi:tripartite-type tricarboxylate transporter receptor subunit TctC